MYSARNCSNYFIITFKGLLFVKWVSQVSLMVKNPPASIRDKETQVRSLGGEDPLDEGMATHSSVLA